jgi:hypothetical protein
MKLQFACGSMDIDVSVKTQVAIWAARDLALQIV